MIHLRTIIISAALALGLTAGAAPADTAPTDPQPEPEAATTISFSQPTAALPAIDDPSYKLTPEWHRHRTLRTLGWTSLGVGTGMVLGGLGWTAGCIIGDVESSAAGIGISTLLVTGTTLMVASVPMLIMSHVYKKRALNKPRLTLAATALSDPTAQGFSAAPAIGFTLTF